MRSETGLVRSAMRVEEAGSAFFKEAYVIVCREDPERAERDREAVIGCLVQIAQTYKLDLSLDAGRNTALTILGAVISLALAEASEDDSARAVQRLRKNSLDKFVAIGLKLHSELDKRAKLLSARSVLVCTNGKMYGLLDRDDEFELMGLASGMVFFPERTRFLAAKQYLDKVESLLALAGHLPLAATMVHGAWYTRIQAEMYARKNKETPNPMGGVFSLFLRSFLLTVMTTSWMELPWIGPYMRLCESKPGNDFLSNNVVGSVAHVREFISDVFFDEETLAGHARKALEATKTLFKAHLSLVLPNGGSREFPPVDMERYEPAINALVEHLLRAFQNDVRAYFRTATSVAITGDDMTRFWNRHLFLRTIETFLQDEEKHEGGKLFRINEEDLAMTVTHLPTLLRVPWDEVTKYTAGASAWPPEVRKQFLDQYDWGPLVDLANDERLAGWMVLLVERFGWELLLKFHHRKLTLAFWLSAWEREPLLRPAILLFFQKDAYKGVVSGKSLLGAMTEAFNVGDDERLLDHLLQRAMREVSGEYLTGVGPSSLSRALWSMLRHPPAVRLLWARISPKLRIASREKMTDDMNRSLDRILKEPFPLRTS